MFINLNFGVTNAGSTDLHIYLLMKKIHPGSRKRPYKLCIPIVVLNSVHFSQMYLSETIPLTNAQIKLKHLLFLAEWTMLMLSLSKPLK